MSVNIFKNGQLKKIAGEPNEINVAETPVNFTDPENRETIESGNTISTVFGNIRKWLSDLKPVAFSGKLEDIDKTAESPLILKKGYGIGCVNGDGTENAKWYCFARIFLNDTYMDYPIELTVGRRSSPALLRLTILMGGSEGSWYISSFQYSGNTGANCYAYVVNTNTVDLYIEGDIWDSIYLHDIKFNNSLSPTARIEQPCTFVSELPSGGIYAEFSNPPSGMDWKLLGHYDIKKEDGTVSIEYGTITPKPREFCIRYGGYNSGHIYGGGSVTTPNRDNDVFWLPVYRGTSHIGVASIFVYSSINAVKISFEDTTNNPQTLGFRVFYR